MNKPHCIRLLHAKAWTLESTGGEFSWTRSFGAPVDLRNATHTVLCVYGVRLPSRVLLNGTLVETKNIEPGRMETEIGRQLLERNKVELVWENKIGSDAIHDGFALLSSVHLEILE